MSRTASPPAATEPALVLCAHGARGLAGAAARHADALRRSGLLPAVEAAALYGAPRLEAVLDRMAPGPLDVLPFMMAEGHTLDRLACRLAACRPDARLLTAVGAHAGMAGILAARALEGLKAQGREPGGTALLLVGHGTTRHADSSATTRRHAAAIEGLGHFAEVAVAFLDEPPSVAEAVADLRSPFIAAVGVLTDAGRHGAQDVARLLAATGRKSVYLGPIGPDPALRGLIMKMWGR